MARTEHKTKGYNKIHSIIMRAIKWNVLSIIEMMITQKNRLEPNLFFQSVNDATNCKRNRRRHFILYFI